jgi:hypothetical protein
VGRALAIVVVALLAGPVAAQSPRAGGPAPGDDPTSRIGVDVGLTGNLARGFVDRDLITGRGVVQAWSGPYGVYLQPYWLYGRIGTPMGKITTDNEIYLRLGLFRTISEPFFVYAVNAFDHSVRRKIDHRELFGGGAGVNLVAQKGVSLLASVGVLGEHANYAVRMFEDHPELTRSTRNTLRASLRVYGRYRVAGGRFSLTHDVYVIPAIENSNDDYRFMFFGAIDAPIVKGFMARMQVDATREGIIAVGTKHEDIAITFGLAYKNEWFSKPPSSLPPKP